MAKHVYHEQPNGLDRVPIDRFAIDYDIPLTLAKCLVGRTERETEQHIEEFINYLHDLFRKLNEWRTNNAQQNN